MWASFAIRRRWRFESSSKSGTSSSVPSQSCPTRVGVGRDRQQSVSCLSAQPPGSCADPIAVRAELLARVQVAGQVGRRELVAVRTPAGENGRAALRAQGDRLVDGLSPPRARTSAPRRSSRRTRTRRPPGRASGAARNGPPGRIQPPSPPAVVTTICGGGSSSPGSKRSPRPPRSRRARRPRPRPPRSVGSSRDVATSTLARRAARSAATSPLDEVDRVAARELLPRQRAVLARRPELLPEHGDRPLAAVVDVRERAALRAGRVPRVDGDAARLELRLASAGPSSSSASAVKKRHEPARFASWTAATAPPPAASSHDSRAWTISPADGSSSTRANSTHST